MVLYIQYVRFPSAGRREGRRESNPTLSVYTHTHTEGDGGRKDAMTRALPITGCSSEYCRPLGRPDARYRAKKLMVMNLNPVRPPGPSDAAAQPCVSLFYVNDIGSTGSGGAPWDSMFIHSLIPFASV